MQIHHAKPGERRIRRTIKWTSPEGKQMTREVIITDKAGGYRRGCNTLSETSIHSGSLAL